MKNRLVGTIDWETVTRLEQRVLAEAPLLPGEQNLLEALEEENKKQGVQGPARRALIALRLRVQEEAPAAPVQETTPGPAPGVGSGTEASVAEAAVVRSQRVRALTADERVMRQVRDSMRNLLVQHPSRALVASLNIQGCCGSCRNRETCYGDRRAQMAHCVQVDGAGDLRLRCVEHQEAERVGAEPRGVCGGPRECAEYVSVFAPVDEETVLGVSR